MHYQFVNGDSVSTPFNSKGQQLQLHSQSCGASQIIYVLPLWINYFNWGLASAMQISMCRLVNKG